MLKNKKYKAIVKINNKIYDTFIIDGRNKKSVKKFLAKFYYKTGVISNMKKFSCDLTKVEFDGNYYIEIE
ncbi:MAG: hypothetical protein IJ568_05050 [Bacilli bacterium]|nr:hypothetical protein [Bacilli bacterium]